MPTLFDTFKTRAEAVSAEVHRVATSAEALDIILAFLASGGARFSLPSASEKNLDRQAKACPVALRRRRIAHQRARIGYGTLHLADADGGGFGRFARDVERQTGRLLGEVCPC